MRYVYTIFWHKNMLNFRLNKFHQRATAHISQAQCAWKCKRDTIIYLYLTTLTFTETRLLIWWVKLLNFLLFLLFFWNKLFSGLWTDLLTSFPGILCRSCLLTDIGWQGQTTMGVGVKHWWPFQVRLVISSPLKFDAGGAGSEVWNRVTMIAPVKKFGRVRLSTNFPGLILCC